MKAILAVDLADGAATSLAAGLRERLSEVRLQRVSLARAVEAVRREVYDVVVLSLVDPGQAATSPSAFVATLGETSPTTRVFVLGVVERQDRALFASLGNVEMIGRPVEMAELVARIATALQRGVKGHLENVGLAAFVQLLALEKETCTLSVRAGERIGTLFFVGGELYDAELGEAGGEEMAIEILGWEVADVEMTGSCLRSRRSIQMPLTFLLIEAMRRRDERGRAAPGREAQGAAQPHAGEALPPREPVPSSLSPLSPLSTFSTVALVPRLAEEVEGFVAAALVDLATGEVLEAATSRPDLDPVLASAFCGELLRLEMELQSTLRPQSRLEEVVLTLSNEIHVLKLAPSGHFLHVVADRTRTSLPALQAALRRHWQAFAAGAKPTPETAQRKH